MDDIMEIKDSSDDSSDSGDEEDKEEQQLIQRAEQLERDILSNKYLYDAHVELISIYKQLADLTSLREAFQRFHECFPLTPQLWLDWIEIERNLAQSEAEKKDILKLFDKAVNDYLSVKLWYEYALHSLSFQDMELTRSILERALTEAGQHVADGSLLWNFLREIEQTQTSSDEPSSQLEKLADIYKRQLSIPLIDLEETYREFQEWYENLPDKSLIDPKPIEWAYKKSLKLLDTIKPFEEQLLTAENEELYEIYKNYIKSLQDPSAIICTYERAINKLCLDPNLWTDYCNYIFNFEHVAEKVSERAVRNCPWSEQLWIVRLRILENTGADHTKMLSVFEQGIASIAPAPGLDLWLTYLEYNHRKSDAQIVDKLFVQAIEALGHHNDPTCKLSRFHARILAKRGEMVAARKLWTSILHEPQNKTLSSAWLEYANLEARFGETHQLRNIFQKSLNISNLDWPQLIAEEWMMFERQFGTLQDVMKCEEKCKQVLKKFAEKQNQIAYTEDGKEKGKKRKIVEEVTVVKKSKLDGETKKGKFETLTSKSPTSKVPKKTFEKKDPLRTVFVSNLHYSVTEDKLKELFPNAKNIDLVMDNKGKSRCFGYVEFNMEEEAMTALARDREPIDGRPMFISTCKEKTERKPVFKYKTETEPNKLFVRGLPIQKSQEDIENLFKPYEAIAVRLVLHKSGQPKGLAYVEFENEQAAKAALEKTDQMEVDGHKITVAVSAPPPKKNKEASKEGEGFGGDADKVTEPLRHARSRLQVPLIPRSLQVKTANENGTAPTSVKKSNADFRNMLLQK